MATIKQVEFEYNGKKRPGLRYDSARKKWIGYKVDIRVSGIRRQPIFPTKGEAEDYIRTVERQRPYKRDGLTIDTPAVVTLDQLFTKRLALIANAKEKIRATRIFAAFENEFENVPKVAEVRSAHFQAYINSRLATGKVKPQSVDREMTILSTAFKDAASLFPHDLDGYEPPKIVRPKYSKRRHRDKGEIETYQKDRIIEQILNHRLRKERKARTDARPVVALMFELAWMLGLRFAEVKNLEKLDFMASERSLRVVRWKTGDVDMLKYLPDRVCEIIAEASALSSTDRVFHLGVSEHTFAHILERACIAAGIPYGRATLGGITFHSTRHSFVTRMSQVTDPSTTQAYSGHADAEMVLYYGKATEAAKRRAMEKMYGTKTRETLAEIYTQTASGNLTPEEFTARISDLFSL